jgi:ApaG protein
VQLTTLGNFDSLNEIEIVDGEGVIGKTSIKTRRATHVQLWLPSPTRMKGYFNMINFTSTRNFKVIVPLLGCAPHLR